MAVSRPNQPARPTSAFASQSGRSRTAETIAERFCFVHITWVPHHQGPDILGAYITDAILHLPIAYQPSDQRVHGRRPALIGLPDFTHNNGVVDAFPEYPG